MNSIEEEIRIWNTPLVNAYLLRRFIVGYVDARPEHDNPSVILCVIALVIMSDESLYGSISNKKKRLSAFVYGFVKDKRTDSLVTLHQLISESKYLCIDAIDAAVAAGIVTWDLDHGALAPGEREERNPQRAGRKHKSNGDKAELLGRWFAELELNQITTLLGVSL